MQRTLENSPPERRLVESRISTPSRRRIPRRPPSHAVRSVRHYAKVLEDFNQWLVDALVRNGAGDNLSLILVRQDLRTLSQIRRELLAGEPSREQLEIVLGRLDFYQSRVPEREALYRQVHGGHNAGVNAWIQAANVVGAAARTSLVAMATAATGGAAGIVAGAATAGVVSLASARAERGELRPEDVSQAGCDAVLGGAGGLLGGPSQGLMSVVLAGGRGAVSGALGALRDQP